MWTDNDGVEHSCPHDEYGRRIPTHEDMQALTALLGALEHWKIGDDVFPMIARVITSYCRQFRNVPALDPVAEAIEDCARCVSTRQFDPCSCHDPRKPDTGRPCGCMPHEFASTRGGG